MKRGSFSFRLCALVCCALMLAQSAVALAQTQPPVPPSGVPAVTEGVEEARRLVREGIRLREAGHWYDAIERFQRACAALDESVCHRNLVLAHVHFLDWIAAGRELQEYFARISGPPEREILDAEPVIYQHVGRLKVLLPAGETDNVTVFLDGAPVPPVHFQHERLRLIVSPGPHRLEARARDRQPVERNFEVGAGGEVTIALPALVDPRGRLHVLPAGGVLPGGVTITVNGRPVPTSHYDNPEEPLFVTPGDHLVEARGSCREATTFSVRVAAGETRRVHVPFNERGVRCRWWFWTLVSVGSLAVIGGAVATGWYLSNRPDPEITTQAIMIEGEGHANRR